MEINTQLISEIILIGDFPLTIRHLGNDWHLNALTLCNGKLDSVTTVYKQCAYKINHRDFKKIGHIETTLTPEDEKYDIYNNINTINDLYDIITKGEIAERWDLLDERIMEEGEYQDYLESEEN